MTSWGLALSGDLSRFDRAVQGAATSATRSTVGAAKQDVRREIARKGLGFKLGFAYRGEVRTGTGRDITRSGIASDPVGRTFSKAIKKIEGAAPIDLIELHIKGERVTADDGALAVPAPWVPKDKEPSDFPTGTFEFHKGGLAGASLWHRREERYYFALVPEVILPARIDIEPIRRRHQTAYPRNVARRVEQALDRLNRERR